MRKSSSTPRWWDWPSIFILFSLVGIVASRIAATDWTPSLFLVQLITFFGLVIGSALGYTRFPLRVTRWISFFYMIILLPLQWTLAIDQNFSLEEQLGSVYRQLLFSLADFFGRSPVEDPLFFIAFITTVMWVVSTSAGFRLVREQNYLFVVLPSAVILLFIQNYDNAIAGRLWMMALFTLLTLLLLGRLNYLDNKKSWHERRVFLSPDNKIDLTGTMAIAAGLIILFSWTPPASSAGFSAATKVWNQITRPWREFTTRMENAVIALDATSSTRRGEFFGSELALGRGFPQSEAVMFRVQTPELPLDQTPPRYYWRGRVYDHYEENQWWTTGTKLEEYSPADTISIQPQPNAPDPSLFLIKLGDSSLSLVYAPSQSVWFSREGSTRKITTGEFEEVTSWYAYPSLLAGEAYQASAVITNPDIKELREAGTEYPAWVTRKYLQLPEDFSPKVSELALAITAEQDNPYDKAMMITRYLREYISYSNTLPEPPRNKDPLEWMLFENRRAYCVYYSSAEVLMLRSLGIPARMAVGFAQGVRVNDEYIVRRLDAHAWPEVYFPDIGWVEFEPTASQPQLNRPLPPREQEETDNINPDLIDFLEDERNQEPLEEIIENEEVTPTEPIQDAASVNPSLYLIPSLIIFVTLTVFFSRRYSVPARLPGFLRTTYERNGIKTPNWILNWEHWVNTSQIQRSFESINFALRILKRSIPIDATPIERASALQVLLPKANEHTESLLDEHQTSLYTLREADTTRARRAAFNIRKYALLETIRYKFQGRSIEKT